MRKIFLLLLALAVTTTQLSACSDEDYAFGSGFIVGLITGRHTNHHHHRRHGPPHYRRYVAMFDGDAIVSGLDEANLLQSNLETKYNLSNSAAEKLAAALILSEDGDKTGLLNLGLREKDLYLISKLDMPTNSSINNVAYTLNESPDKVHSIFESVISELRNQAVDVDSAMWQSCVSSGMWKTPENSRCSDLRWNGCSPDTGATLCVAR